MMSWMSRYLDTHLRNQSRRVKGAGRLSRKVNPTRREPLVVSSQIRRRFIVIWMKIYHKSYLMMMMLGSLSTDIKLPIKKGG